MSEAGELDVEDRFAIVPEWLLGADISDAAVRLYAVLLRFGQTSGARMPARSTLTARMRKKSTDTIDRALRELVELGAVVVQNRFDGGQRLTNKYLVRTTRPRHGEEADRLITECGIADWGGFTADCQALRRQLGQPVARWSSHCLLAALQLAVRNRGWSPTGAAAALRTVAADPATRSPMRLAEAGPWWDEPAAARADSDGDVAELATMEADLADAGGPRPLLQRQARDELTAGGTPLIRATVTRRAHALLCARRNRETGATAC